MVYFIGVEVGVTLNLYTQDTHELCKVNEVKLLHLFGARLCMLGG